MHHYRFAVIFDMDGVVVDNTKYHALAWQTFLAKYGKTLTLREVKTRILGRFNREIFADFLERKLKRREADALATKKEAFYRKMYAKAIRPVAGLPKFLEALYIKGIPIALATAAPSENVRWVLRRTGLKKYFSVIIDDTGVKRGKPFPDIFLQCAKRLHIAPEQCVVFEDGKLGILAAKRAGMRVIGVATTEKPSAIRNTDLVIQDFKKLTIERLQGLFR